MVEVAQLLRRNWLFVIALLWLAAYTGALLWPAQFWMTIRSMAIYDGPAHAPVVMAVDRRIHRPFHAEWDVLVRRQDGNGWTIVCTASGGGDYIPAATLPAPLTLKWWTNDRCATLDVGTYYVSTLWRIDGGILPRKMIQSTSNVFRIGL